MAKYTEEGLSPPVFGKQNLIETGGLKHKIYIKQFFF